MSLRKDLGHSIRRYRERAGLSQAEFAARLGRSTQSLSKIERGVSAPTLESLEVIARVLAVPVRDLFTDAPSPQTAPELERITARLATVPAADLPWVREVLAVILRNGRR